MSVETAPVVTGLDGGTCSANGAMLGGACAFVGHGSGPGAGQPGACTIPPQASCRGEPLPPVLAHSVRHQVLAAWGEPEVPPRLKGRRVLRRCADDVVIGGALAADARKRMVVRPTRLARDGVPSPPTKTALMVFRKPAGR